jgi:hypothetical protein
MSSVDAEKMAALLDALVPGDGSRWPRFSMAVRVTEFLNAMSRAETEGVERLMWRLDERSEGDLAAALEAAERSDPEAFATVLRAGYRAYYTAPTVLAAVGALADEGPREPSLTFDRDLVAKVMATGAGKRRL